MAEKDLTEAAWKAFDKDKKYKADALAKALRTFATLEKGGKGLGGEKLKALKEIEDEADDLRKAYKADKDLDKQLKKIEEAVTRQRKDTEREIREEEQAQEEEADSPVLLTKKMVPLLRDLRKGEARMSAMICTAGKSTAVLIMRRAISPSRFKLLTEFVDAAGGAKKIVGECMFEAGALTFVVQSPAAGLAKRLRQALIDQTEMKFKVRVRGEDGAEDQDGEDGGDDQQGAAGTTPTAPPGGPASTEALEYTQRLRKLTPRYDEARQAKHPELTKLTALMGMASERASAEPADYAGAIKALMGLEKLLDAPLPTKDGSVDPAVAFNARLAALMPKIKEFLAIGGPGAAQVKLKVSEAGALAKQGNHEQGQALLDAVESLLTGQETTEDKHTDPEVPESDDPRAADYNALARRLRPQLDAISRATLGPDLAKQFQQVQAAWGMAEELAGDENFERAAVILNRLAEGGVLNGLLQAIQAQDGGTPDGGDEQGYEGIVAYRAALLAYRRASATVSDQIAQLRGAIPANLPGEQQLADDLAAALKELHDDYLELVDEAMKTAENQDTPTTAALASSLDAYANEIVSNPLVRHVDNNPFGVSVTIGKTLGAALADIQDAMPATR